jgi:hypothetical protein
MTWEQPPETGGRGRWVWPAAVLVTVAAVMAILLTRADRAGTLTVGPIARPATGPSAPAVDHADFEPTPLGPLRSVTRITGERPLLPDAPDLTLVTSSDQELRAIDLATGDGHRTGLLTQGPYGLDPWTLFGVGDHVISHANNHVVRLRTSDMQLVRLARNHFALPTFDDDTVWMLESQAGQAQPTVLQVRIDGTVADQIALPPVAQPQAGISAGVVLSTPSGIHLASGDGIRRLTTSGQLVAVSTDQRLAWLDCAADLSCQIVIGTFADPAQVRVPIGRTEVPGGFGAALGRFSPDERLLAVPMLRFDTGPEPARTTIVIIDTATGAEASRIPAPPAQVFDGSPFAWSPDSSLLFMGLGTSLSVWNAGTEELIQLDAGTSQIRGLAVTRD